MRRPNTECDWCAAPIYRRPAQLARGTAKFCGNTCRGAYTRSQPRPCVVDGCSRSRTVGGHCQRHQPLRAALPKCKVPACERKASGARGLCGSHYRSLRVAEKDADPSYPRCLARGCTRAGVTHGYCDTHKHGALEAGAVGKPCVVDGCVAGARGRGLCSRHWSRSRTYGLSVEQLADFDRRPCAACGGPGEVVDHDHSTGRVRDVLCHACNKALGTLEDSPKRLRDLADYIEVHNEMRHETHASNP